MNLQSLIQANSQRWQTARYHQSYLNAANQVAVRLCEQRAAAVYRHLESLTGVPWWVVAVIHEREAAQRWDRSIAQGDRWDRVSVHVPKGRGPFNSFVDAAVDALMNCPPYAARWKDWSPGGALTLLELYNGTGYEIYHRMASPYVWSGTQHYVRGKYVADGRFDPNEVDRQLGCAVLLVAMHGIDATVLTNATNQPLQSDVPLPAPDPRQPHLQRPADPYTEIGSPDIGGESTLEQVSGSFDGIKSIFKSKIAWLTGSTATTGATAVANSDNNFWSHVTGLIHNPAFWIVIMFVVAAAVIYYRWRDHGRGQLR